MIYVLEILVNYNNENVEKFKYDDSIAAKINPNSNGNRIFIKNYLNLV